MRLSPCSFRSKVILLGVGAALVPVLILGAVSYQSQKRVIEKELRTVLSSLAGEGAEQVGRWMSERRSEAELLAKSPSLREETARLLHLLAAGEGNDSAPYRVRRSLVKQSLDLILLGYRWVTQASIGDPRTGKTVISTEETGLERPEEPAMQVSATIGEKAAPLGVLTLHLNVAAMQKELLRGNRFFTTAGINSLDLYLITGDGRFLTPSVSEPSLPADGRPATPPAQQSGARVPATGALTRAAAHCQDLLAGRGSIPATDLDGYVGYHGMPVVGAWNAVPGTGWCVIAEVGRTEALAPVTRLLHITLLILLGIGSVFGLLALALSSSLTVPLTELTALAGRMAAGDRSVRFRLNRRDEIGLLAASFDRMAATIEQHLAGLEATVQERTANLVAANRKLEREIQVRKNAEEALAVAAQGLRDNEQKFRTLVDNIPGAIYLSACDADWTMEFLSDAIADIVGYPASDFLQNRVRSYASIIHPEDRVLVETAVRQGVATRAPFILEYRVLHADGAVRWVYEKGQGVFDADGRLLWLDGAIFDITERKRAQQRLAAQYATTRVLAESATLAEAVPRLLEAICKSLEWEVGLLWRVDREANVLRCVDVWTNPVLSVREFTAMSRRLTFAPGAGLPGRVWQNGKPLWVTDMSADPNYPRAPIAAAEGLRAGFGLPVSAGTDVVGVIEFFTRQAREPDEEVLRMLTATGSQIGQFMERVRAQETLQEREEQLRQAQKMEAIGRLAGGIAHDFNNLLTAIMGYSQLLLRKLEQDDPCHRYAAEIHQGGERAARLTGQLLAFSRKQVLQPRVLDLNGIVTGLDLMLHRLLGEHIKLDTVLERGLSSVKADPGQIEQVLLNLAVNSRDAMPNGGRLAIETANVELDAVPASTLGDIKPGAYVRLTVADTGCGMAAETLEHIFEPFFTTKGREKGTGLGLATVYGIVRQSGGAIEVVSEPGAGTTFHVYLPRVSGAAEVLDAAAVPQELLRGSETILLVEDEVAVRSLARQVLEQNGYTVLEATNGGEAIVVAEQHRGGIALLITDVVMPGMNGPDVAERLAALRREIRVLYISGYADDAIGAGGVLEAGMAYLPKPFSSEALLLKVREVLDRQLA